MRRLRRGAAIAARRQRLTVLLLQARDLKAPKAFGHLWTHSPHRGLILK